jgi:murein DD-endopeptidase MepM/ murein hydrolase activator NlpD
MVRILSSKLFWFSIVQIAIITILINYRQKVRIIDVMGTFKKTDELILSKVTKLWESDSVKTIQFQHLPRISPIYAKDINRVSSVYGMRNDKFHAGIDLSAKVGTVVIATASGIIKSAGWKSGYGDTVEIDQLNSIATLYGHLSKISVVKGQFVFQGDTIGLVGNTGLSTGPHLHYEILADKNIDPNLFLKL